MLESEIIDIKKRIVDLENRLAKLEGSKKTTDIDRKKLSIKELFRLKKPKNDVQKTLLIGYYLEKYENMTSFNVNDIKNSFRDAKEKLPLNVWDKIQLNLKKGHMDYMEKKDDLKAYMLTSSGEDYVENDFKD